MNVGIIGLGIVGFGTYYSLKGKHNVYAFDVKFKKEEYGEKKNYPIKIIQNEKEKTFVSEFPIKITSIDEVIKNCEVNFVCVPSPMKESGEIDKTYLNHSIESIIESVKKYGIKEKRIIMIKSTAISGTTREYINKYKEYKNIVFGFNPEFLVEATYLKDALNPERMIIGIDKKEDFEEIKKMFLQSEFKCPMIQSTPEEAETIKYASNCFLATKVAFANQLYDICQKLGVKYDKVIEMLLYDKRFGKTHWKVPGPDGDRGFGGKCFPKDLNAFIHLAESKGYEPEILKAVWSYNKKIRKKINWKAEDIKKL